LSTTISIYKKLLDAKFKFDQAASDLSDHKQDIEFLKKSLKTLRMSKIKGKVIYRHGKGHALKGYKTP
jgi:hypothetical protein